MKYLCSGKVIIESGELIRGRDGEGRGSCRAASSKSPRNPETPPPKPKLKIKKTHFCRYFNIKRFM